MTDGLPRLFAYTDDAVLASPALVERAAALAGAAGPALAVVLRSRALAGRALLALAERLAGALRPRGAWLAVSGRADVARAAGAQAIVAGRGALGVADLARVAPSAVIGRSVHGLAAARAAAAEGARFLVAGAVHGTPSHPDQPAGGPDVVRAAAETGLPVIAIGGMTPERVAAALAAGAHGVAAIRALWDAGDPAAAAAGFVAALPAPPGIAVMVNGEPRQARAGISLADLIGDLGLDPRAVVVEHNRRIVRRESLASTPLGAGDRLELVHFVGGG